MANEEHLAILKQGVEVWNQWRQEHPRVRPDLQKIELTQMNLSGFDLHEVEFSWGNLSGTDLSNSDLSWAIFVRTRLYQTNLSGSNLSRANFQGADLTQAALAYAHCEEVWMGLTTVADVDLSQVYGLETIEHLAPSTIGIDTIYRSQGRISEVFLRGVGLPDQFIEYMRSLIGKPIEYYSCFISYSSKDEEFARRLHEGLQANNVRCWFAPEDLPIGEKIRLGIDQAIRKHDKLLLVLSEYSVTSDWVEQEVETAFERERQEQKLVLIPVRLDKAVMDIEDGWPSLIRNTRNIGDFTRWKDHDAYQKAFERLLRDLKAAP